MTEVMAHPQGWNRMTIKDLLDKVDLDPSTTSKMKNKMEHHAQPQSAYLGPKLYKEDDFFVMNINEFLEENNLLNERQAVKGEKASPEPEELDCTSPRKICSPPYVDCSSPRNVTSPFYYGRSSPKDYSSLISPQPISSPPYHSEGTSPKDYSICSPRPLSSPSYHSSFNSSQSTSTPFYKPVIQVPTPRPGVIVSSKGKPETSHEKSDTSHEKSETALSQKKSKLPKGENDFLYSESKRAKIEREKEEKRKRLEVEIEFAPEDLALATLPGANFDPRHRAFDTEELRPQPIIRKRPKLFVPEECKDNTYWDRRSKNNVAARRSREARRLKENQIALRAAFLEKENSALKKELEDTKFLNSKISTEKDILKMKLSQYEAFAHQD